MYNWLRTDESQEAVLALQIAGEQLSRVVDDPHYWAWVIVLLHNSLQGFMVLALRGTNDLNVLTKKCAAKWMAVYEQGGSDFPRPRLDTFLNLYKKIKSDRMMIYCHSRVFQPTGTQDKNVRKLNELRNEFIHFVPKGWSLELTGLPQIVEDCLAVIAFLAFESQNILWHEELLEARTRTLIAKAKSDVDYITKAYGAQQAHAGDAAAPR